MVSTRSNRIPMTSLTALTLHSDRKTASRRHPPIPQLTCEGKLCRQYQPDVVQCVKVGEDGVGGLEWKCEAELPRGMRFGEIEVGCEGWDGPDDPFILKGSCGLTYRLVQSSRSLEESGPMHISFSKSPQTYQTSAFNIISFLILGYFLLTFIRSFLFPALANLRRFFSSRQPGSNFWPGGGGGGGPGGGGGGGPPPPYTPKPSTAPQGGQGQAGWRPGFWSGLAAGAAANHLLRPQQQQQRREEYPTFGGARRGWGNTMGGATGGGRSNWGFGGGNLRDNDDDWDRGVGGSGLSRSTGFGGTRNR